MDEDFFRKTYDQITSTYYVLGTAYIFRMEPSSITLFYNVCIFKLNNMIYREANNIKKLK